MSDEERKQRLRDADRELARTSWRTALRGGAPLWASLGIAVVFTVRAYACDPDVPDGLNFRWYGEHCGPGHGTESAARDELDEACRRHDEAYRNNRPTTGGPK